MVRSSGRLELGTRLCGFVPEAEESNSARNSFCPPENYESGDPALCRQFGTSLSFLAVVPLPPKLRKPFSAGRFAGRSLYKICDKVLSSEAPVR